MCSRDSICQHLRVSLRAVRVQAAFQQTALCSLLSQILPTTTDSVDCHRTDWRSRGRGKGSDYTRVKHESCADYKSSSHIGNWLFVSCYCWLIICCYCWLTVSWLAPQLEPTQCDGRGTGSLQLGWKGSAALLRPLQPPDRLTCP